MKGRHSGSIEDSLTREYIASEFSRFGLTPKGTDGYFQFFKKSDVTDGWGYYGDFKDERRTANVIGYIEGSDAELKKEVIVIGSHLDHVGRNSRDGSLGYCYGADDNASGTAGVMELAQYISKHRDEFKRSFIFICFDAEEDGLLGSYYFTSSNIFKENKIVAMLNLDMIGRLSNNNLTINAVGTSDIWTPLANKINESYKFDLSLKKAGLDGSDHRPFFDKGIPTIFFFTGLHNDYHTPRDVFWKINTEGEETILKFVNDIAKAVSNDYAEIKFTGKKKN